MKQIANLLIFLALFLCGSDVMGEENSLHGDFLRAAKEGKLEEVKTLIQKGAFINYLPPNPQSKYGYLVKSALEEAAIKGHLPVVEFLLKEGADLRFDAWYGLYAATWATQNKHNEVVLTLWKFRPLEKDPNPLFGPSLISAARQGNTSLLKKLLELGLDPNWHTKGDHFPSPALLNSALSYKFESMNILLAAGADPDVVHRKSGITPLHAAAAGGQTQLMKDLIQKGAPLHKKTRLGNALSLASCSPLGANLKARNSQLESAQFLLENKINPNIPAYGRSPLKCAKEHFHQDLVKILEENGAREFETMGKKLKRAGLGILIFIGGH